jgi:predicted nucleic acid-binding protein
MLYHLGGRLADPLPVTDLFVSIVTEIELLSFPGLSPAEELAINQALGAVVVVDLTTDVKLEAIRLRRQHRVKLADSIVMATASLLAAELWTNDLAVLRIPGIRAIAPALAP